MYWTSKGKQINKFVIYMKPLEFWKMLKINKIGKC